MALNLLPLVHLTEQAEESVSHFSGSYDTPMHRGGFRGILKWCLRTGYGSGGL